MSNADKLTKANQILGTLPARVAAVNARETKSAAAFDAAREMFASEVTECHALRFAISRDDEEARRLRDEVRADADPLIAENGPVLSMLGAASGHLTAHVGGWREAAIELEHLRDLERDDPEALGRHREAIKTLRRDRDLRERARPIAEAIDTARDAVREMQIAPSFDEDKLMSILEQIPRRCACGGWPTSVASFLDALPVARD
jgi:hypothetical protein